MRIYNTLTKKVETFKPYNKEQVTLYTCGPTVYNYVHLGNLRTYIFEDVLEKTLIYFGYKVKRVMNITDVGHFVADADDGEDKVFLQAQKEGKTMKAVAAHYTAAFFADLDKLNIRRPKLTPKASDHVNEYIKIITKLLKDGFAYQAGGNVYFDISKMPNYYQLSGKKETDLLVGARAEVVGDINKYNPFDFGLWFTKSRFSEQEMKWDSPWGVGYPGWHIECTGLSLKYLGPHLDIHCGGVDNIFPHHTNEIAQAEAYLGHQWCRYWIHGEHLNDKTGKMSKSKGKFLTLTLIEDEGYSPLVYRFFCLQSHYRKQLVFTKASLKSALNSYQKLKQRIRTIINDGLSLDKEQIKFYQQQFKMALGNDLNTANALTCLYDVLKDETLNGSSKLYLIKDFDHALSLNLIDKEPLKEIKLEGIVMDLIKERNEAKAIKDYERADEIRLKLKAQGIILKDTKTGTVWEREKEE